VLHHAVTRSAEDIGAGLAAARPARPIRHGERIHVVGAAGAGASAAALLAAAAGAIVTGCDPGGPSPYTPALEAAGIDVAWRHDAAHVTEEPRPDRLAVTKALTAVEPNHPELVAARDLGIPEEPWQQVIADAAVGRTLVAVAGTHGKSTTVGWLTHILAASGADPSAFVGALLPASLTGGIASTARRGKGRAFVVEADEYAGNFGAYRPAIVVLTNIEWDHPDVFADRDAVVAAFEDWLRAADTAALPTLIANVGDPGVGELLVRLGDWPARVVRTRIGSADRGFEADRGSEAGRPVTAEILEAGPDATVIEIDGLEPDRPIRVRLPTAGVHNVANALGVAAAALELGLPAAQIVAGLEGFEGVGRRLERKGAARGVVVYDDYGHHPTAIRATIAAVRQREPGRRLWVAIEPLTFHRTAALLEELAAALTQADGVAVADIWPGRDPDRTIASAGVLAEAVQRARPDLQVAASGTPEATADWLAMVVRPGDVVLAMGGGRSYRIPERLLERLAVRDETDA
jgi:UDP-N-acetylmuramate--alanine ligase